MFPGRDDLGHHHAIQTLAQRRELFHFQPGHGQRVSQFGTIGPHIHQFAQPVFGEFHIEVRE